VKKLEGQVAIVTGGASGIGRAVGMELAKRGCEVVLADRQHAAAQDVVDQITRAGGSAVAVSLDVRELGTFERIAAETIARRGRIDFLFNNAGIAIGGEVDSYDIRDWEDVFDVNLRGVANGIQAVYPYMIERKSGHIVNTASVAGLIGSPGAVSYSATKHAVVGLSKGLRAEAHRHGVSVSVLCPGAIRTPILGGGKFGRTNFENVAREKLVGLWEKVRPMDPAIFAKKAVDAVLRDDAIIVIPSWWKALWFLERLSPTLSMRLWRSQIETLRRDLDRLGATRPTRSRATTRSARDAAS
jgi:NAD(P)-dependent dehydrogenase (short-subunit alcohol dehydrogenase family)